MRRMVRLCWLQLSQKRQDWVKGRETEIHFVGLREVKGWMEMRLQ